jgi:hypothetical protein
MRIRWSVGVSAVALVAFLGGCEEVSGPDPVPEVTVAAMSAARAAEAPAQAAVRHPVEVSVEGESRVIGWCDESAGVALVLVTGVGTMTHVGRFETEQTACNSLVTGEITDGEAVSMAANGDETHMTWSGRVVPGVEPQTLELTYLFDGGTGRFVHARGRIDFVVVYTSETDWVASGTGWISYEASDRSDR